MFHIKKQYLVRESNMHLHGLLKGEEEEHSKQSKPTMYTHRPCVVSLFWSHCSTPVFIKIKKRERKADESEGPAFANYATRPVNGLNYG